MMNLVDQYFENCAQDARTPSRKNLNEWLWFICPAEVRSEVGAAIMADPRFTPRGRPFANRIITKRVKLTPQEAAELDKRVSESGDTWSQYVRSQLFK